MNKNSNHRSIAKAIIISVLSIGLAACGGGGGSSSGGGGQPHPPSGYQIQLSYHNTSEQKDSQRLQASGDGDNDIPFGGTGQITATLVDEKGHSVSTPSNITITVDGTSGLSRTDKKVGALTITIPKGGNKGNLGVTDTNAGSTVITDTITITSATMNGQPAAIDSKPVQYNTTKLTLTVDGKPGPTPGPTPGLQKASVIPQIPDKAGIQVVNNSGRDVYVFMNGREVTNTPNGSPNGKLAPFTGDLTAVKFTESSNGKQIIWTGETNSTDPITGASNSVKIPKNTTAELYAPAIMSARLYFSYGAPLPALTKATNADPKSSTIFNFFEFTYGPAIDGNGKRFAVLNIDQSNVDNFSWPLEIEYAGSLADAEKLFSPAQQAGYSDNVSRQQIIDNYTKAVTSIGADQVFWNAAIIKNANGGGVTRILSPKNNPNLAANNPPQTFVKYMDWLCSTLYSTKPITINSTPYTCKPGDNKYTFESATNSHAVPPVITIQTLFSGVGLNSQTDLSQLLSGAFMAGQLPPKNDFYQNIDSKLLINSSNDFKAASAEHPAAYDLYAQVLNNSTGNCMQTVGPNKGQPAKCGIYVGDFSDVIQKSSDLAVNATVIKLEQNQLTPKATPSISIVINPEFNPK